MQPGLLVASMPVTLSGSARSLARSRRASTERRANKAKRNRAGAEQGGQVSTDLQEGKRASACHLSTHPCLEVWGQVQNQHCHQCSRLLCFLMFFLGGGLFVFSRPSTAKLLFRNSEHFSRKTVSQSKSGDVTRLFCSYVSHCCIVATSVCQKKGGGGRGWQYPNLSTGVMVGILSNGNKLQTLAEIVILNRLLSAKHKKACIILDHTWWKTWFGHQWISPDVWVKDLHVIDSFIQVALACATAKSTHLGGYWTICGNIYQVGGSSMTRQLILMLTVFKK